jgi:hypothetical protein
MNFFTQNINTSGFFCNKSLFILGSYEQENAKKAYIVVKKYFSFNIFIPKKHLF